MKLKPDGNVGIDLDADWEGCMVIHPSWFKPKAPTSLATARENARERIVTWLRQTANKEYDWVVKGLKDAEKFDPEAVAVEVRIDFLYERLAPLLEQMSTGCSTRASGLAFAEGAGYALNLIRRLLMDVDTACRKVHPI